MEDVEALKRILEWYEKEYPRKVEYYKQLNLPNPEDLALRFEWYEVGIHPATLTKLVRKGYLKIVYKSRSHTEYQPDIDKIRQVLELLEKPLRPNRKSVDHLFSNIIGYDDVKEALRMIIETDESLHCLLIGPPATAKTLFLEEIYNYYGDEAEFVIGSQTSSAGLSKLILEKQPKALIIDEIDKLLKVEDLSVLLSIMERGIVRRVKGDMITDIQQLKVKVFAAGNTDNLPQELKSRFKPFIFYFKPYTKEQFIEVCVNYLSRILKLNKDIIEYTAKKVYEIMGTEADVRAVRNLLKLCKTNKNKIDFMLQLMRKYSPANAKFNFHY